jgi:hypothetical protein
VLKVVAKHTSGVSGSLQQPSVSSRMSRPVFGGLSFRYSLRNPARLLSREGLQFSRRRTLERCVPANSPPGFRHEFHAGLQQGFGKYLAVHAEYVWKYTHNSYEFRVLGNTRIIFPIDWHNSKIPGYAIRARRIMLGPVRRYTFTCELPLGGVGSGQSPVVTVMND